jgi:glyoxylate reductase
LATTAQDQPESPTVARCFVTRKLPGTAVDRLAQAHEVDVWPEHLPPTHDDLLARVAPIEGLISLPTDPIDVTVIHAAPQLRAISNYAVGYDNIDLAEAKARGIPVGHTPGVLTDATADLAFTLLLAVARQLPQATAAVRAGEWLTWGPADHLGVELAGATLGIVGFGRIGQAVAKRADGFGMRVIHTGSTSSEADVDELLAASDFVSLHAPLTASTRHLVNSRALERMKPTAILINTARGGMVDQYALAAALTDGTIAGAGLDVTEPEPIPPDDPLLKAPNLVLTPHIGSATTTARERMADMAVDNLIAGLAGEPMPHPVPE